MITPLTITHYQSGLVLGYTVLNLDRTVFAAFSSAGMAEVGSSGVYAVAGGVAVPDGGGYVQVYQAPGMEFVGETAVDALGALAADVAAIRLIVGQLDVSGVTVVARSYAGHLVITAGLTFVGWVTGLPVPADWTAALLTIKRSVGEADSAAVLRLRVNNPAMLTDGVERLNGSAVEAPLTALDGSLAVSVDDGRIDVWLSDELTVRLRCGTGLGWDVKFFDAAGDSSGWRGSADVVLTETKEI